jgi:hypothetical protein
VSILRNVKMPKLPSLSALFRSLWNRPPLSWARKFPYRQTFGILALLLSIAGFFIIARNPMPWIESFLPIHITFFWGGWLYLEQAYVQTLLNILYTDVLVTSAALGAMSFLVLLSLVLLVQNPMTTLKILGRGIRRSPRATLYSPITFYRRIIVWRNWLLSKVEYLQSESAKWKTLFSVLKSPYSLLRSLGLSPNMAIGLLFAGSTVGTGVVVNETILSERSFGRGDSGTYSAPLDAPVSYTDGDNTLRIDLGVTPVREITIENVSVGSVFTGSALPSGEQNVVDIGGNVVTGGTNTRLVVGHLIFENSRCKKLELTDIQAHTIIIRGNASDGQSISPSPGTSRMRAIGGGHHQADAMVTSGGTYDRILINAPVSAVNGKVDKLRLSNLFTRGGICALYKMNIGTLEILLNEIGNGDGFATKEFSVASSVSGANIFIEDNVEESIGEPPIQ